MVTTSKEQSVREVSPLPGAVRTEGLLALIDALLAEQHPCWAGCPCRQGAWPAVREGQTIHPHTARFVANHIVRRWRRRGVVGVSAREQKPLPTTGGEPLTKEAVRAVAHALLRGERYSAEEVMGVPAC